jgi:tetratricopeptide (TPR) repeat protein
MSTTYVVENLLEQGDLMRRQKLYKEAERRYEEALAAATEQVAPGAELGDSHLAIAECWSKLGRLHEQMGHSKEADHCYHEALEIFSKVEGDEYFELSLARDRIAVPQ